MKAEGRGQKHQTADAPRLQGAEDGRQRAAHRMAHEEGLGPRLARDVRDSLGYGPVRVFVQAGIFMPKPIRCPLEEIESQAMLQTIAHCADRGRKIPYVRALDGRRDDKYDGPAAAPDIRAQAPA